MKNIRETVAVESRKEKVREPSANTDTVNTNAVEYCPAFIVIDKMFYEGMQPYSYIFSRFGG